MQLGFSGRLALAALTIFGAASACAKPTGTDCELNSDCLQGYCQDGTCRRDCVDSEKDCPKGYTCNTIGQCEFEGSGGAPAGGAGGATTGPGPTTSTSTGPGPTTSTSTGPGPSTTTGVGGGTPGSSSDLTLCSGDGECASGMCRAMAPNNVSRCTHACSSNGQCPSGFRCETVGGETYCAEADIGRACTGVGQCNFACLTPLDYCTSTCGNALDCPAGFGCMPVGNPAVNVCVRASADCAADTSQCVAPAACDTSATLVVSSCTLACSSALDCPQRALGLTPWSCDAGGICRRPADVYGPLPGGFEPAQWACNAASQVVNVCNDGLHIDFDTFTQPAAPAVNCNSPTTTDGAPGDACLDTCRYQGACPYGFSCDALAQIGQSRVGLCMPQGFGEVGAACGSDPQCAFGFCKDGVCSRDCSADGVCPNNTTCQAIGGPTVEGVAFRACL
ncbi:MAG: hypothetical protein U0271_47215 [Polyangiaceae bacterium]